MYTRTDLDELTAQLKKRIFLLAIPGVLLLAGIVFSLCIRSRVLTTVLSVALGVLLIFSYLMFIAPVRCYRAHVDHALNGKVRTATGFFKEMEESPLWREGLMLYPMLININDMKNEEDDRLFYFDARLPRPDWQQGQKLTLTSYDKLVTAWEAE